MTKNILTTLRDNPISVVAIALSSLAGGLLIWGFFGTLKSEVTGTGLIVRDDHLIVVTSHQEGIINKQYVKINDTVQRGNTLMRLDTSQQQIQIDSTRQQLKTNIPLSGASVEAGQILEATNKYLLEQAGRAYRDQAPSLEKRKYQQQQAYQAAQSRYKSGIVSASDLSSAFNELSNIKSELLQLAENINNTKTAYQQARQQNAGSAIDLVQQGKVSA